MLAQAISAIIEKLFNQALRYNLHGTSVLKPLDEKTLTLELSELGFPLNFTVTGDVAQVTSQNEYSDCTLTTSINTIIELKKQQQLTDLIKQDKLDIQGDIKVAQRFVGLAESLDIDWQSELAKRIGDVPTYKLGQAGKSILSKLRFASQQIQADASEWFVHEKKLIVPRTELELFNQGVNQAIEKLESIEQRIAILSQPQSK